MNSRRSLAETMTELIDGIAFNPSGMGVRATSIELSLPVEIALEQQAGETVFLADLPQFIYRTAFDRAPSRLTVFWQEQEVA